MFIISQYILNISGICTDAQQVPLYSIALGLVLYSSLYLYILFYNSDYLGVFNTFVIYVIIGDLVLSAFYYFNQQNTRDSSINFIDNKNYICNDEISFNNYFKGDYNEYIKYDKNIIDVFKKKYENNFLFSTETTL